jgi:hypothetical protein
VGTAISTGHAHELTDLPMMLGNMRANGVRTLAVWCPARSRNHHSILDVSGYGDDVLVPEVGLATNILPVPLHGGQSPGCAWNVYTLLRPDPWVHFRGRSVMSGNDP